MFKTYRHAELSPAGIFGDPFTRHWQFIELELHHPWFYVELVRDHGDDIVGSMLMIPTVPDSFNRCYRNWMIIPGSRRRT